MGPHTEQQPSFADEFIMHTRNISQALVNLNHLTCAHAESPALVRSYANLVEQRLHALRDLLGSLAPEL